MRDYLPFDRLEKQSNSPPETPMQTTIKPKVAHYKAACSETSADCIPINTAHACFLLYVLLFLICKILLRIELAPEQKRCCTPSFRYSPKLWVKTDLLR